MMMKKIIPTASITQSTAPIRLEELEICPEKVIQLLNSTLQHGILTQQDMISFGISHVASSDIFGDPNSVRVNLVSNRHNRVIGAVIELALSKQGTGAHSVVLEQQKDTLFLRTEGVLQQRKVMLELSEREMHSFLVLINPRAIDEAVSSQAIRHDDQYADRTPQEHGQPPFEYKLLKSIPPQSFIKVLLPRQVGFALSKLVNPHGVTLSLVGEKEVNAHYYDAGSRTNMAVTILAPDFEHELQTVLEEHNLIFTHALRGEVPKTREVSELMTLGDKKAESQLYTEASKFYSSITQINSDHIEAHLKAGNCLVISGSSENRGYAWSYYEHYAKLTKQNFDDVLIGKGKEIFSKGDTDNLKLAGYYFNKVISRNSENEEAHFYMGSIFQHLSTLPETAKLKDRAITEFRKVCEINPYNTEVIDRLQQLNIS